MFFSSLCPSWVFLFFAFFFGESSPPLILVHMVGWKLLPKSLFPWRNSLWSRPNQSKPSFTKHGPCEWLRNGHVMEARLRRLNYRRFVGAFGKKMLSHSHQHPADSLPENKAKAEENKRRKETESWWHALSSWYTMHEVSGSPRFCGRTGHACPFCLSKFELGFQSIANTKGLTDTMGLRKMVWARIWKRDIRGFPLCPPAFMFSIQKLPLSWWKIMYDVCNSSTHAFWIQW